MSKHSRDFSEDYRIKNDRTSRDTNTNKNKKSICFIKKVQILYKKYSSHIILVFKSCLIKNAPYYRW